MVVIAFSHIYLNTFSIEISDINVSHSLLSVGLNSHVFRQDDRSIGQCSTVYLNKVSHQKDKMNDCFLKTKKKLQQNVRCFLS